METRGKWHLFDNLYRWISRHQSRCLIENMSYYDRYIKDGIAFTAYLRKSKGTLFHFLDARITGATEKKTISTSIENVCYK